LILYKNTHHLLWPMYYGQIQTLRNKLHTKSVGLCGNNGNLVMTKI